MSGRKKKIQNLLNQNKYAEHFDIFLDKAIKYVNDFVLFLLNRSFKRERYVLPSNQIQYIVMLKVDENTFQCK